MQPIIFVIGIPKERMHLQLHASCKTGCVDTSAIASLIKSVRIKLFTKINIPAFPLVFYTIQ